MNSRLVTIKSCIGVAFAIGLLLVAGCGAASIPTITPIPATSTPTPEPTVRPEVLTAGRDAFVRIGCVACHEIKGVSDGVQAALALTNAYQLISDILKSTEYKKSAGKAKTPREYITESILDPDLYTEPTCPLGPCIKGTMPTNYKDIIRPDELKNVTEYLLSLGR
ncbi:MAG TPA: c-type cytochrome [Anaerolineae bacterium]